MELEPMSGCKCVQLGGIGGRDYGHDSLLRA
nr:hypothetical protein pVPH1_0186 [Vibrio parahaemolyticus]